MGIRGLSSPASVDDDAVDVSLARIDDALAGWFEDPLDSSRLRFFDGERWTEAARPADGSPTAEVEAVDPARLLELAPPGTGPAGRSLLVPLLAAAAGLFAVLLGLLSLLAGPWLGPERPLGGSGDAPAAVVGDDVELRGAGFAPPEQLVFTVEDADPVALLSFGEGCVVEAGPSGAEYRLGTSTPEGVEVGVAATVRSSGYTEVSVVMRYAPTEPEQLWVFSSDGAGSGELDAEMDGSGFSADLVLSDGSGGVASLVGSAACGG